MGDRGNVYVRRDAEHGVYLYTHWCGSELPATVGEALRKGKSRWNDPSYLARIIFCEMIRGDRDDLAGFGISDMLEDNEHPIVVVDVEYQRIQFVPEEKCPHNMLEEDWTSLSYYADHPELWGFPKDEDDTTSPVADSSGGDLGSYY